MGGVGGGNKEIDVEMKIVLLSKVRFDSEELNFFFLLAHECSHSRAGAGTSFPGCILNISQ